MKIAPYENRHLWKFPYLKIPSSENHPLENFPQENYRQKINPKKIVAYESCHHSRENLKVVIMRGVCVIADAEILSVGHKQIYFFFSLVPFFQSFALFFNIFNAF